MSRYPGTQFRVHDNSQATAMVPVTNANPNDTVQYLTSFASVKGPEGITLTSGEDFYTRYGTQDNIDFKKFGQPLLQASMNVNNGAAVLAKRAVLDDATLGNATLAVVLTKYKDAKVSVYTDSKGVVHPELIGKIKFDQNAVAKYSLAPMVFSVDNVNNYVHATAEVNEYKERYDLYKNYIQEVVANENTPNNTFLNKLFDKGESSDKVLSGFSQSIYYDEDDKIIDVFTDGKDAVRKISSITSGLYAGKQKTYSTNFDPEIDILNASSTIEGVNVDAEDTADNNGVEVAILKASKIKDGDTYKIKWEIYSDQTGSIYRAKYSQIFDYIQSVSRFVSVDKGFVFDETSIANTLDVITKKHPEWLDEDYNFDNANPEFAAICVGGLNTDGYTSVARLVNDMMVEKSGYIDCEYVFPMFTIFDNGRGESIKTISIEYDAASSVTLKKAIYSLGIYNYATSRRLEKFSFSLNPYARNNNTGYTFDIESAVNYVSEQVSAKTYYDSYDALLDTIKMITGSNSDTIIETTDILFGHTLNGKYPIYNSYYVSTALRRSTCVYDYAHLDVFDNDAITVNVYCDSDNMTLQNDSKVKYYYYNYIRSQKMLLERLEKGSDGYCLDRTIVEIPSSSDEKRCPFIVIDTTDKDITGNDKDTARMSTIMALTGHKDGTVISASSLNADGVFIEDISENAPPVIQSNFVKFNVKLYDATVYNNGAATQEHVLLTGNNKTKAKANVFATAEEAIAYGGKCYCLLDDATEQEVKVWIPYSTDYLYQEQYRRFFNGDFDRDIFNLDVYFPNALFDANYSNSVKMAIQRLAAFRGDFMCYMDMGINNVRSYADAETMIPSMTGGLSLVEEDNEYNYIRDMHIAVTCLSYKIRNPYDNKVIPVTATYGLSNLYIGHYNNDVSKVFAGISNNITIDNIIEGTVSYIPKIYPTNEMTSINNIGGIYPSDDETIINEKQLMCDLRVNYGCYYDDRFSIETEYTMNPTDSEFSYWNNVALVCIMMQAIRRACPSARYQFVTSDDLTVYQTAVETAMKPWRNRFADLKFKYVQDDAALENKIYYAAIEVVFKPFAQAEIFELTALNYSTLSSSITNV